MVPWFRPLKTSALLALVGGAAFVLASSWVGPAPAWEPVRWAEALEVGPGPGALQPATSAGPTAQRGVYLTANVAGDEARLEQVIAHSLAAGFNAIVVDVKDNGGTLGYASRLPLAQRIGAVVPRYSLPALVAKVHARGLYFIARLVAFYDPQLAGYLGRSDRWVLPSDPTAVGYNLEVAQEVAAAGVDEVQFDYVRFPDDRRIGEPYPARSAAVTAFLRRAQQLLADRVQLSADVYGRTLWDWNADGTDPTGQLLDSMAPHVTYLSPMVYPSHYEVYFQSRPYEVVRRGLSAGLARGLPLRPFLQAFELRIPPRMSAVQYLRAQLQAVEELGVKGYLFWNPRGDYRLLWRALALAEGQT